MVVTRFLSLSILLLVSPATTIAAAHAPGIQDHAAVPATPRAISDSVRIARLAGLGRAWGAAKYFHPSLAFRPEIDWDSALVAAIPRVREARNAEEYAAAVQAMLAVLDDPLTRVIGTGDDTEAVSAESEDGAGRPFGTRWTADSILIITTGDYYELPQPTVRKEIAGVAAAVPKARAVVFDLRSPRPTEGWGRFQLEQAFGGIQRLLTADTLLIPGDWRRVYYGFESSSAFSSGQYRTGYVVENGSLLTPADEAREIRSVFILNADAGVIPAALPLQAAGKARVVYEGDIDEHTVGHVRTVKLADGLVAQVRESVSVFPDGTSGAFRADVVVQPDAADPTLEPPDSVRDAALDTALALARRFGPSVVTREHLPASVPARRERSYGDMPHPELEYRVLAAVRIWNAIEYFYPYKDLLDEDWAEVLPELLPVFEAAANEREYTVAVVEMAKRVQDSHAYVAGDVYYEQLIGEGYPPIRVRIVEDEPVVTALRDTTATRNAGIAVGDVILQVDGESAKLRLARTASYFSASTPQSRMDRAALSFMCGPVGSSVTLLVRDRNGREKQVVLERRREDYTTLYHREREGEIVRLLPGNIGYVDLDRLRYDMVEPMFETLMDTRGIIFDMRGYPYGTGWAIAPRLADSTAVAAVFATPMVGHRSPAPSVETFRQVVVPDGPRYTGRTLMLVDERTMSQAEHTGLWLRAANGTLFVGSPTAGADGEITTIAVPSGMTMGFTGQAVTFPDGSQLQRVGLTPDVYAAPTIQGIRAGRDEVLEAALRLLTPPAGSERP